MYCLTVEWKEKMLFFVRMLKCINQIHQISTYSLCGISSSLSARISEKCASNAINNETTILRSIFNCLTIAFRSLFFSLSLFKHFTLQLSHSLNHKNSVQSDGLVNLFGFFFQLYSLNHSRCTLRNKVVIIFDIVIRL